MKHYPSIHETFSAVAARLPDHIALLGDGHRVSYRDLDLRSDAIAQYLASRGITSGAKVGLYAQRSVEAVAAMLGILKAGAAYVPFDPSYPPSLLRFVYQDCRPGIMLVQTNLLENQAIDAFWQGESHDLQAAFAAPATVGSPLPAVMGDDLAYVMYTSGSTGHPKGVLVPHRGVVRLVIDTHFAQLGPDEVHLQLAPLAFDASTFEIWGALLNGAKLAVLSSPYPSLDDIAHSIAAYGVTTLWLTAGLFHLMVDQRLSGLAPLRQLIAGGDILSPTHVARVLAQLPQCQLINGYGPTENTTFTCTYRIPANHGTGPVPIGTAIRGTSVHILDSAGSPVADGEEGELFAGGAGVGLGYLNRPELTAERFVPDPFEPLGNALLYRTGDRVRRGADGNIYFLGRVDRQVKINGKRVELDEIEASLRRCELIEDAAVTSPAVAIGSRKIHAYVKLKSGVAQARGEIKNYLKQSLPDYMNPASLTLVDVFPLSPTGKVDRAKLPPPDPMSPPEPATAMPPPVGVEATLARIWREVLGTDHVGSNDNFFDLGGTSLQLMQVHATIAAAMQSDITVVELFQFPSIGSLAAHMSARGGGAASRADDASAGTMLTAAERARRQQAALTRARVQTRKTLP